MNITLCSAFRNSVANGHLSRYLAQCHDLDGALYEAGHRLSFVWGEGDSTDDTLKVLTAARWRFKAEIVDCTHGGAEQYGSVVRAERFRQLAHVGRCIYAALPADCAIMVWAESDLIWKPKTVVELVNRVGQPAYPRHVIADLWGYRVRDIPLVAAVAPPIILHRAHWGYRTFYDVAFFVKDGRNFDHQPPWHPGNDGRPMVEMERVGSMVAMDANYVRKIVMDERVIGGVCDDIRALGGAVWFAADLEAVIHE